MSPDIEPVLDNKEQQNVIPHFVLFTVLHYVIGTSIVLVNSSILLAFVVQRFRRPNLARLSPAGLLVLNLLGADALVGVNVISLTATNTDTLAAGQWFCSLRLAGTYLTLIGSHIALINIAVDRYIAIMHTLHYRDWMTMQRSLTMIVLGWLVPIAGAFGALLSNDWQPGSIGCGESFRMFTNYVWVPSHVFAFVVVIAFQGCVYLQLRRYERMSQASKNVLKHYSKKSAKILYLVTTTFVLCWGPFDVILLIMMVWSNETLWIIFYTLVVVANFSFLVNPTIYSYKTENIRKPVNALFLDIKAALKCSSSKAVTDSPKEGDDKAPSTIVNTTSSGVFLTQSTSLESTGHI